MIFSSIILFIFVAFERSYNFPLNRTSANVATISLQLHAYLVGMRCFMGLNVFNLTGDYGVCRRSVLFYLQGEKGR